MKARTCFVVCPIGDEGSETRIRADLLSEFLIEAVLGEPPFSMKILRADKLSQPGIITNQIIAELESSDLVVADLTDGNPNVFYEVAIRHVTRKPFVHLITKGQRIPFDNAPVRAIEFDLSDLRSVDTAKKELAAQADHALSQGQSESPVSIAATLESLRKTGSVENIALANMLSAVSSLQGSVDRLAANQIVLEKRLSPATGGMFGGNAALRALDGLHPENAIGGLLGTFVSTSVASEETATPAEATIEKARRELGRAVKAVT